jgi:hypothetical protein
MTRNSSTRRSTLRTASQVIATLALAVSLVACGDSISGPTSNPTTNSGGGTMGNGSGSGSGSSGSGNGGGTSVSSKTSVTISHPGYPDESIDMGDCSALLVFDGTTIMLYGTEKGGSFAFTLNTTSTRPGRYIWNYMGNNNAWMNVGSTLWSGSDGETVITGLDVVNARIRGYFKGIVYFTDDNAKRVQISGTFDVPLTR